MTDAPADIRRRLAGLMVRDRRRLEQSLRRARGSQSRTDLLAQIDAAEQRVERRRLTVPAIRYPADLPITARRPDILDAIRDHQVVIVAGETGSGKSTQLPKLCLEAGLGVRGLIGHTQPRRIAARAVAERVAEELGSELGDLVGYTVRFTDRVRDATLIRVMTDGILLAELQRDRALTRYDTIIVDEAHERSLNIDFILGYLRQLLPRRPDLKVIITSATIDTQRFARHFGDAPVIEVSGRTYPVELRYRPPDDDADQPQAIGEAIEELWTEGPGDILVFLSGEREIRDAADALNDLKLPDTEILPLYARLTAAEQHRVFEPHHFRRVVLATNVAETSLTVPGIRYVVDPGTARISRYSRRTKVQRLPIERVSQASANQRAGRCGRVAPGVCIRLYSEDDYAERTEFNEPEILRTNLASVILQMTALGIGDVETFPFVDPPDRRNVRDGIALLQELGALDERQRLTKLGRRLAQLPLDPRLGRMILEAERHGCVREVTIIAAALSIQDPRERPTDRRQAADEQHRRFADPSSDFLAYLNLWDYLERRRRELSSNQFRKMCRAEFLNHLRVREWQDIFNQLRDVARDMDIRHSSRREDRDHIHISVLAGLLSHIGFRDGRERDYLGARGARFAISPASALFRRSPRWVMAGELVETTRLWAHTAAQIDPEWAEPLAPHLTRRTYGEPQWDPDRGNVYAHEKVVLYGLPIVAARRVDYARIDAAVAREIFIRRALVEAEWETRNPVIRRNREVLDQARELADRARRRDLVIDDHTLFGFYDERLPTDVVSARHFEAWFRRLEDRSILELNRDMVLDADPQREFPDAWRIDDVEMPLHYTDEGLTVQLPLTALNRIDASELQWQVPGRRTELIAALIRTLPRKLRRNFVASPDLARDIAQHATPQAGPLREVLARELTQLAGVPIGPDDFELERLPAHLRVVFAVQTPDGRVLASGEDLDALRATLQPHIHSAVVEATRAHERAGLLAWDFGDLPQTIEDDDVTAYPALVDERDSVAIRMLPTAEAQHQAMRRGLARLLLMTVGPAPKAFERLADPKAKLALAPHDVALDDCLLCAAASLAAEHGAPVWDAAAFDALAVAVQSRLVETALRVADDVAGILTLAASLRNRVRRGIPATAARDIGSQLDRLVGPRLLDADADRLPDVARYLRAVERRLDKIAENPSRDEALMTQIQELEQESQHLSPGAREHIAWMLEELRVSLFAQHLGTAYRVSVERVLREIDELDSRIK